MVRAIFAILSMCIVTNAFSQSPVTRPATGEDFVGYWKLLPYPEEKQPKFLTANLWPGACQYFIHDEKGVWIHLVLRDGQGNDFPPEKCNRTKTWLKEEITFSAPKGSSWEQRGNLFLVKRERENITEPWKVDIFTADVQQPNVAGFDIKSGDVLMQLVDMRNREIVWRRILRRVED